MKKRLFLIIVATLSSMSLYSQRLANEQISKHEFRLGVGAFPVVLRSEYGQGLFVKNNDYLLGGSYYHSLNEYRGPKYTTGSISLGYTYAFNRWLSLGGTISYTGEFRKYYDRISDRMTNSRSWNDISVTPMIRFTYLNHKYVRLYSQLGVGLQLSFQSDKFSNHVTTLAHITGQATFLGVSVGNRLFGFGEMLGVGNQGAFVIGIGYKF